MRRQSERRRRHKWLQIKSCGATAAPAALMGQLCSRLCRAHGRTSRQQCLITRRVSTDRNEHTSTPLYTPCHMKWTLCQMTAPADHQTSSITRIVVWRIAGAEWSLKICRLSNVIRIECFDDTAVMSKCQASGVIPPDTIPQPTQ